MRVLWTCRRALQLRLNEYLVVGPSVVTDLHGMSDSMVAELFESVRLFLCNADCAAHVLRAPLAGAISMGCFVSYLAQDNENLWLH